MNASIRDNASGLRSQLPLFSLTTVAAILLSIAGYFGGRMMTSGDTSIQLSTKLDGIVKQNDNQDTKMDRLDNLMREVSTKQYTRDEARQDREANERKFQSMGNQIAGLENRISELSRRMDFLETSYRALLDRATNNNNVNNSRR